MVRPFISNSRVGGTMCFVISASAPTAMILPPAMAIACAIELRPSTVMM